MIVDRTGEVVPGFHVLGAAEAPVYLMEAPRPVLFDAGFSCLGPLYAGHARQVLGQAPPAWLCLTHVHFDHCGAAAHLLEAFPGLTAAASAQAAHILSRPGALELMARLNRQSAQLVAAWRPGLVSPVEFKPFAVGRILEDSQELDLGGGLSLMVLATPGHTRDFLSYYIPQRGILVCSEASGCAAAGGHVISEFLVDYDAYLANFERFLELEPRVLCQGHRLVYVGQNEARGFLERSRQAAREFRAWVEDLLDQEHGQVEAVVARVKAQEYDPRPHPKQPEPAYLLNLGARVAHLAGLRPVTAGQPAKEERS
ncbi:MAG: MBL fold metallo-hydrolase [Desulfarculus sp.]|nr:MBL fold metallo-hydrolase [Desulfarculus sp.]